MQTIHQYIDQNRQRFIDELFTLLRIPSVSSIPEHKPDMYKAAECWKNLLLNAGADKAEVFETQGNPVTYGEKIIDSALPTVLVYAHMDVMPVDPLDLWKSNPFEPEIRDGKIFARGADDDKGQSLMHAKAFEYLVKTNQLKCNVKFMIEGEEEVGSTSMPDFCRQHKEMLKADFILVSDTSMIAQDVPSITVGLRGLAYMEVEVTGPDHDLHSGLFGGAVANPANILCKLIASLHDDAGRITIPGFYDDVLQFSATERDEMSKAPFSEEQYKNELGIKSLWGEKGYSTIERTGIRPTLDVNGIWSGYTGEGSKTVLPSKANAKISMRLVANQDYKKTGKLFEDHFRKIAPDCVTVKVQTHHGGQPYSTPTDFAPYRAAEKAYMETFGKKPIPVRSGGSIPIIATFEEILGLKSLLLGFGLGTDAIHSPNENFPLWNYFKGIETIATFYLKFCEDRK